MSLQSTLLSKAPATNITRVSLDLLVDIVDVPLEAGALAERFIAEFTLVGFPTLVDIAVVSLHRSVRSESGTAFGAGVGLLVCVYKSVCVCRFFCL